MTAPIIVKNSSLEGKGVFSTREIKKGERICFMRGKIKTIPQLKRMYNSGIEREGDPLQISATKYIDLQKPYIFFNHSCSPNAAITKFNRLVAIKSIKKGEEIKFDYSATLFEEGPSCNASKRLWGENIPWEIDCKCRSKNCRKKITDFEFLPSKTKEYYLKNKFLQTYLLNKLTTKNLNPDSLTS